VASTVTLGRTVNLTQRFIRKAPLTFVNEGDPAFSIADSVRQFILSPPFAWRWNRAYVSPISCIIGVQDYPTNVPNFGWIEKATLIFPTQQGTPGQVIELEVGLNVASEVFANQPTHITAQLDDDNGNITFRLFPPPDQTYQLKIIYQQSSPQFKSLTDLWAPIPDYFSFLYNQGMRAYAYEYAGDERFGFAMQLFMQQVVAANQGLSETERSLFLDHQMNNLREQEGVQSGKR
jgi:hypothetical protein